MNEGLRQNQGFGRKLTLISAPAGFGKTTLVSEWGASCERPEPKVRVAWLSLDEGDNDPTRFLAYLVAALQTIAADIGEGVLGMLHASQPQPPPTESILTALLNEITAIPDNITLVLDDYHVIDAKPIDAALTFLLEHLPPQMHLVIASREDPQLPLARYRVRGQLTELRAADLRFTPSEAAEFLNRVMGLNLSAEDIAALEARTEGWIAGLQLAALALQGLALQGTTSMQGHQDAAHLIQSFTGSHHFVLDYLLEEVLQQQPESIQTFLLRTSILDRLCGPLCEAVLHEGADLHPTRSASGQETLEYLERANLFIVPLDNERHWYRYHRLFADLLRQRLALSMGDERGGAAELHNRASLWYEENGYEAEAFHHVVAADDFERAAGLAEMAWQAMDNSFQSAAWLGWVKKLPDKLIRARPVLCTQVAQALMDTGELEASESRLRDAERWLDTTGDMSAPPEGSAGGMVVADKDLFRTLPAWIAVTRAYNAQVQGDFSATVKYAELALKLTPEEDHFRRAQATVTLEFTHWASGDLEAASRAIADWMDNMQKAGNIIFVIASAFALADIMVAQGRLREAVRTYQQSLQLASAHDKDAQRITAHHYLGLSMLYHEMDDQEAAAQHLQKARELGEQSTLVDWPYRWHIAQAHLKETGGDLEAALDLLDAAKRVYVRNPVPDTRPIEALKARVYLRQGRLTQALDWAHERGLSIDDDLSYLREFEHITLARVRVAEYQSDHAERCILDAMGLLERLLKAAEEGRRMGSVIEILVVQALAHQAQNNIPLALASLERALVLAEPEGYVRIFVDEGEPMRLLILEFAQSSELGRLWNELPRGKPRGIQKPTRKISRGKPRGIRPDKIEKQSRHQDHKLISYVDRLLAAFARPAAMPQSPANHAGIISDRPNPQDWAKSTMVEPLSQRELEVLELIAQGLSNREISERLFLALSTVKGHSRIIFDKLQVQRRTEAVARARELGLL